MGRLEKLLLRLRYVDLLREVGFDATWSKLKSESTEPRRQPDLQLPTALMMGLRLR